MIEENTQANKSIIIVDLNFLLSAYFF